MKKVIIPILLMITLLSCQNVKSNVSATGSNHSESFDCDIQTTNRPDGNVIKYFNPQPVSINNEYELGISIYKNETIGIFYVTTVVLFKNKSYSNLSGDLIVQTTSTKGLSLKQAISNRVEMNGNIVNISMYEITEDDYEVLQASRLKMISFGLNGVHYGATITENETILIDELKCFNLIK